MARVSYLRPAVTPARSAAKNHRRLTAGSRPDRRGRFVAGSLLLLVIVSIAVGAVVFASAHASLKPDSEALAHVSMPLGGGKIERVSVVTGPHTRPVPVQVRGDQLWPLGVIPAREQVSIDVVVKRPGWIAWLAGSTERLHLTTITPSADVQQHYLTLRPRQPLVVRFSQPIEIISYGTRGQMVRRVLSQPITELPLRRTGEAGTLSVAAVPRRWETTTPDAVSWFPAGAVASAVAQPAPGSKIGPRTAITLTFSKTVQQALGSNLPPVSPVTPGTWQAVNSHTIVFAPQAYGYGLGATVSITLPSGVKLVGARTGGSSSAATWNVPGGTTLRLQQLLAQLGYLPLRFSPQAGVPPTAVAQEAAAIHPPRGSFSWRYPDIPGSLRGMWAPGADGVMTKGALMRFEDDHGLSTDGVAGPTVWKSLIAAADEGKRSGFGYTFVSIDLGGQHLNLWHNGHTVLTSAVNTGISQAPTASGTFPVYEHIRSGTMSGTNPDGSHYDDPGIQFISYFNGGDALHAFTRAQYGFPQSLGCVEMALGPAGQVWPYTPIGTLVHVA